MLEEAYRLRTGLSLELPSIDLDRPRGEEWAEDALATTYPLLVRHYAWLKDR